MPDLKFGKREIARVAEVLDREYSSVEEAAEAVLAEAQRIHQDKAKWCVLGQLRVTEGGYLDPDDPLAVKVCIAWFPTETQAKNAAAMLTSSTQTWEEFRVWIMPVFHGTPAEYYRSRKRTREEAAMAERSYFQRELHRRQRWFEENPDATPPEDMRGLIPLEDPEIIERRKAA